MSKTAVEWLLFELSKVGYLPDGVPEEIHKQAKAMEREQIEESYYDGTDLNSMFTTSSEYYEQTYGKEASNEG